jgi:hypothetical protein
LKSRLLDGLLARFRGFRAGAGRFGLSFPLGGITLCLAFVLLSPSFTGQSVVADNYTDEFFDPALDALNDSDDGF